ncbi:hypothetical protein ACA910_009665 [Epithemia clementina (nom. ined.)]
MVCLLLLSPFGLWQSCNILQTPPTTAHHQTSQNNSNYQWSRNVSFHQDYLSVASISRAKTGIVKDGDSSTGKLANYDEPFRTFLGKRVFLAAASGDEPSSLRASAPSKETAAFSKNDWVQQSKHQSCFKWAVMTTIFAPTTALQRAAALSDDWCTVVVADTKTPVDYMQQAQLTSNHSAKVVFLSVPEQERMAQHHGSVASRVAQFVQQIPWRHCARKNIGYLYAIGQGAKFVFDFDDDNILNLETTKMGVTAVVSPVANETHLEDVRVAIVGEKLALNPHPLMGATLTDSWPRGFPLEYIQDVESHGTVAVTESMYPMSRIGVVQYCADRNPDIDAIHRFTKPLPMDFDRSIGTSPLLIPRHTMAPYNAQATVHTSQALWATLLPFTVPGRVSDIWRGYFAQALLRDLDLALVFAPPIVHQHRNVHSYLADMKAEEDLYFKTRALLNFLRNWKNEEARKIPARMEALWIDLYERGYIEENDVYLAQLWLGALVEVGYCFPGIQ